MFSQLGRGVRTFREESEKKDGTSVMSSTTDTTTAGASNYCSSCGKPNAGGAKFCSSCGTPLAA